MKRFIVFIVLCVIAFYPLRLFPAHIVTAPETIIQAIHRPFARLQFDERSLKCLAENIYYEARGEGEIGMKAVAFVTLNRVSSPSYPNNICAVVFADGQFTWDHKAPRPAKHDKLWQQSREVALNVLKDYGAEPDPTKGSLFYHEKSVAPEWSLGSRKVASIGNHVFYKAVNVNR